MKTARLAALGLLLLLAACNRSADGNEASRSNGATSKATNNDVANPKTTDSDGDAIPDFSDLALRSSGAMAVSGLSPAVLAVYPKLKALKNLEKSVAHFTHCAYVTDGWSLKTFTRTGYIVLLGQEDGRTIGLTTRCSLDFNYPGFQFVDPNNKAPQFLVGAIAIEPPRGSTSKVNDIYVVNEETETLDPRVTSPNEYFQGSFLKPLGISESFWQSTLEAGDRIRYRTLGKNDLVFVEFYSQRMFGTTCKAATGGLEVVSVVEDSVAFRAGVKMGDILTKFNNRSLRTLDDLGKARDATPLNKQFEVTLRRKGEVLQRHAQFNHLGNFFTKDVIGNLGLDEPFAIVNKLMGTLAELGSLLNTEFYVHCEQCHERIERAKIRKGKPRFGALSFVWFLSLVG